MKSSNIITALALAFASTATAQSACNSVASAIPTCGQSCLLSAGSAIGCSSADYACQCTSSAALQSSALNCVVDACGIATGLAVQASASAVCSCIATATPAAAVKGRGPVPAGHVPRTLVKATAIPAV